MESLIISIIAVALIMAIMAVGVVLGRPPLKGSCGGVYGNCACGAAERDACRRDREALTEVRG